MGQLIERGCLELVNCLEGNETTISGPEKVKRLKVGAQTKEWIVLGLEDLKLLMEEQDQIPEVWKEKVDGKTMQVYFHKKAEVDETTCEEKYRFLWWSGRRWQTGFNVATADQNAATPSAISRLK